jgi:uncharacterized membrane protein
MNSELLVAFISAMPVLELRFAVPYGMYQLHLPLVNTYIAAVLGNIAAGLALLFALPYIEHTAERFFPKFHVWMQSHFAKARHKFSHGYAGLGAFALLIMTSMPLPIIGGAWTAAVVAHVLGLPKKYSVLSIVGGVILMGLFVSMATIGYGRI